MKIKFIESTRYLQDGTLLKTKKQLYPSLTFPLLAALTPPGIELSLTHEIFDDVDFDEKADLVALTCITNNALRTYEISDEFRRRKVPVVMGGFHISAEPEEALEHADSVFIGEAEETWPQFLHDFERGTAKRIYKATRPPSLDGLPLPRYSILNKARYVGYQKKGLYRRWLKPLIPVQTARGCSSSCDFCDVALFHEGTYRARPVADVVDEIKTVGAKFVCFVDDNIFADYSRAKELFRALIPLKIVWIGQGTICAAEDEELVGLARRSGCFGLLIGLETLSQKGLESVGKNINEVERYERNLQVYKKAGISVDASMVFGFDDEEPSIFEDTYRFLIRNRIPFAGLQPLRPSPGTPFYERLKAEGRLKVGKWWLDRDTAAKVYELKFTGTEVGGEDFSENLFTLYKRFYSLGSIARRFLWPPQRRFLLNIGVTLAMRKKISRQAFISEY